MSSLPPTASPSASAAPIARPSTQEAATGDQQAPKKLSPLSSILVPSSSSSSSSLPPVLPPSPPLAKAAKKTKGSTRSSHRTPWYFDVPFRQKGSRPSRTHPGYTRVQPFKEDGEFYCIINGCKLHFKDGELLLDHLDRSHDGHRILEGAPGTSELSLPSSPRGEENPRRSGGEGGSGLSRARLRRNGRGLGSDGNENLNSIEEDDDELLHPRPSRLANGEVNTADHQPPPSSRLNGRSPSPPPPAPYSSHRRPQAPVRSNFILKLVISGPTPPHSHSSTSQRVNGSATAPSSSSSSSQQPPSLPHPPSFVASSAYPSASAPLPPIPWTSTSSSSNEHQSPTSRYLSSSSTVVQLTSHPSSSSSSASSSSSSYPYHHPSHLNLPRSGSSSCSSRTQARPTFASQPSSSSLSSSSSASSSSSQASTHLATPAHLQVNLPDFIAEGGYQGLGASKEELEDGAFFAELNKESRRPRTLSEEWDEASKGLERGGEKEEMIGGLAEWWKGLEEEERLLLVAGA